MSVPFMLVLHHSVWVMLCRGGPWTDVWQSRRVINEGKENIESEHSSLTLTHGWIFMCCDVEHKNSPIASGFHVRCVQKQNTNNEEGGTRNRNNLTRTWRALPSSPNSIWGLVFIVSRQNKNKNYLVTVCPPLCLLAQYSQRYWFPLLLVPAS